MILFYNPVASGIKISKIKNIEAYILYVCLIEIFQTLLTAVVSGSVRTGQSKVNHCISTGAKMLFENFC